MKSVVTVFCTLAALGLGSARGAELASPEQFLRDSFGWTIAQLDHERGVFGDYRAFACFDDRPSLPTTDEAVAKWRRGTPCQTVRKQEDLGAMIFVTWINPRHPKPLSAKDVFDAAAREMAGRSADEGSAAKCGEPEKTTVADRTVLLYDCAMVLPFGTYFASFVAFEHRGIPYFLRVQNASAKPIPDEPAKVARKLRAALVFVD